VAVTMLVAHHVMQRKSLTFLHPAPRSPELPQFPNAFALGAIEPTPNKAGEMAFQRRA
jgi:hypothetical protein